MLRRLASLTDPARARVAQLRRAFDARAQRERVLVIGVALVTAWFAADHLWLADAVKSWSTAQVRLATAVDAAAQLNLEVGRRGIETRSAEAQLRAEVSAARARVEHGEATLRAFGTTLVSATDMVPMLDHLLARSAGVRLRAMQSLGRVEVGAGAGLNPTSANANAASAPASAPSARTDTRPTVALYRHGVELTLEGTYAELLAYVQSVEAMPQHVLWGGMQLKVEQYPLVVLTLRLYTLSPDRSWLEI